MKYTLLSILLVSCAMVTFTSSVWAEPIRLGDVTITRLQSTGIIDIIASDEKEVSVNYEVIEDELYVECFVNGFVYSEEKAGMQHKEGEGHLRLYVNDEHVETLYQAAFIVRGLPSGDHDIQVMIVKNDRTPYDLVESFQVSIP